MDRYSFASGIAFTLLVLMLMGAAYVTGQRDICEQLSAEQRATIHDCEEGR